MSKRKLVQLTAEQNKVWTKLFEHEANSGCSGKEADRRAWVGLCEQYPELRQYDGAKA